MEILENYYGRQLLADQVPEQLKDFAVPVEATVLKGSDYYCRRCNTKLREDWLLPEGSQYCRECIVFGRISTDDLLYRFKQEPFKSQSYLNWQGQLTELQKSISNELVTHIEQGEDVLVHAVTGAGKTEMIYQVIENQLCQGHPVAIVSPRIDVCRELYQRFKRDFTCDISLLHSGSKPYKRSPLLISTTHQLFKFYQAFDLIVVDEVDAFPFVDNRALYQAVDGALSAKGRRIYLTATSTENLEKQVKKKELVALELPRRFHAHPLVVPKLRWLNHLDKNLSKNKLPKKLIDMIGSQRQTGYPLLIFFPTIKEGEHLAKLLQKQFPKQSIAFVSSISEGRKEIVEKFRTREIDILVTTTILERGVTFPKVDVFVLDSHHHLYTKSALVQISGRVGRSLERTDGLLIFFYQAKTKQMTKAIKEIKEMNRLGGF